MIDGALFDWAPLVILVVVAGFFADYSLTHLGARAAARVRERWSIDGSYEMNPTWQAQIDSGRWFGWRVLAAPVVVGLLLAGVRVLSGLDVDFEDIAPFVFDQAYFAFAAGVMLLIQAPILMLHVANLQTFSLLRDPSAAVGGIRLRRWVAYRQSALYLAAFGVLWLLLWLLSRQAFFLGGVASCAAFAWRFVQLGRQARRAQSPAGGGESDAAASPA